MARVLRAVAVIALTALALLGAAGMSSLEDDDFCAENYPSGFGEGSGYTSELSAWPPGWRCVYDAPDGGTAVVEVGSIPWFLVALAGVAGVAAWFLHRRRSTPARLAATTTVALAAVGACGLIGGFLFGFTAGMLVGVPLAWLTDIAIARSEDGPRSRPRSLITALVAGAAIFVTAVFALLTNAVLASFIAVALVALTAAAPAALLRRAR